MTWPAEPRPAGGGLDRWLRELRRAVLWRRRLLTAGLLAGAMAFALHVLAPPPAPVIGVVVAARDLTAGSELADGARVVDRPATSVPAGALTAVPARAVLAAPVRRGEVLTDVRLVGPSALRGLGPGLVAAPVRVADAEEAALLHVGDVVDVLAARPAIDDTGDTDDTARLVASAVRVLSVPTPDHGPLSGVASDGALLLVATTAPTAARLAASAVTDRLSVVLRGS